MPTFLVGAALQRPPTPSYAKRFGFAEWMIRPPLPQPKTLRRWRYALPQGFRLAVQVPYPALAASAEDAAAFTSWLQKAVEALDAHCLVLATPASVTPGGRQRQQLQQVFEKLQALGKAVVWQPGGLWGVDAAQQFADRCEVTRAIDPRTEPVLGHPNDKATGPASLVYYRIQTAGALRNASSAAIFNILNAAEESSAKRVCISIVGEESLRFATTLKQHADRRAEEVGA